MNWSHESFDVLWKNIKDFLQEKPGEKSNFPQSSNDRLAMPKPPLMREGLETEKQLAKIAFRTLSVPIKNLFLGLTDVETNLAKSQKMIQESALSQMIQEFEAHVDILLQKLAHTQDVLVDLFRECENRVIQEWSSQVEEKSLAEVAFLLVQLLRKMDSLAETLMEGPEHEMYLELRADHDARSTGPSVFAQEETFAEKMPSQIADSNENKYKLQKRTLLTFRQARECFDFLKRRTSNQVKDHIFQKGFDGLQEQSRNAAKARLLLHDLYEKQDRGALYPEGKGCDQWLEALDTKQKAEETLLQTMNKSEESALEGSSQQKHVENFRDLQALMDRCETSIQKMRNQFVSTRSQITFSQRKEQEKILAKIVEALCQRKIQWKPVQVQELSSNMARLERARDLMTKELNTVLQNSNIKSTDVEIISQSIRNGVLILYDTEMQELYRESKIKIDRILFQVSEAKAKLVNVLV